MAEVVLTDDGGEVVGLGDGDLRVRRRERNGEVWLAGPDPLDARLAGERGAAFADLLREAVGRARADGAGVVHWESDGRAVEVDDVATRAGLVVRRDILRLERDLPVPDAADRGLTVRSLRPGSADEQAWVRCNNRAFARHPDQGQETLATLHAAMAEPWFDAAGFLVLDGDPPVDAGGRLDGFCWTKVHPADDEQPAAGEIYVIGVDPDAGGRGLGPALVLAGLAHMADRGLTRALLYVDADNAPARRMYDRLGFHTAATRRVRSTLAPLR